MILNHATTVRRPLLASKDVQWTWLLLIRQIGQNTAKYREAMIGDLNHPTSANSVRHAIKRPQAYTRDHAPPISVRSQRDLRLAVHSTSNLDRS